MERRMPEPEKSAVETVYSELPALLLRTLVQGVRDPVKIVDRNYRMVWTNCLEQGRIKEPSAYVIGKYCYEVFMKLDKPCFDCPVTGAFSSGDVCIRQRQFSSPSGSTTWREIRAYPLAGRDGVPLYAMTIGFDVTSRKLSLDKQRQHIDALESALRHLSETGPETTDDRFQTPIPHGLTSREHEVLRLLAAGLTNRAISRILSISPHTVKSHVDHILNKLDAADRTEAAVRATRMRII
jgi:DNA-binding CsgD family transcriptional regulator